MHRYQSVDLLKVLLIVMIVAIHGSFLYDYSEIWGHIINNGLFRVSVPVFFVINGYFLETVLRKNEVTKWAKRLFILYLVWMLFYIPYWLDPSNPFRSIIEMIFGFHHLWYISALFGAGCVLYAFRNFSTKALLAVAFGMFLIGLLIQYTGQYHLFFNTPVVDKVFGLNFSHRNFLFIGFPFLTAGYLIRKEQLEQRVKSKSLMLILLACATLYAVESAILYINLSGQVAFDVYLMSFFVCPIIFLLALKSNIKFGKFKTELVGHYVTAIYLIHPIFIINYVSIFKFDSITVWITTLISSLVAAHLIVKVHKRFKYIL